MPGMAQAGPDLPRKPAGPGLKAKAAELYHLTLVFLAGLQQWSKFGDAKQPLRSAGIGADHPLDRFTSNFTYWIEKIYRVGFPANQLMTDAMKKELCRKRDRAIFITFSAAVMVFIFLITRLSFSWLNPVKMAKTLEARHFSSGMTRAEVEAELGRGITMFPPRTLYIRTPGNGIEVTYDETGGLLSPQNHVVGYGIAVLIKGIPPNGLEINNTKKPGPLPGPTTAASDPALGASSDGQLK
jgi:hypothetical protein